MIKITVGGRPYEVQFRYTRIELSDFTEVPNDTYAELRSDRDSPVMASGYAKLHYKDRGKFCKPTGRKIALKDLVSQMNWSYEERAEFWNQVLPLVRK